MTVPVTSDARIQHRRPLGRPTNRFRASRTSLLAEVAVPEVVEAVPELRRLLRTEAGQLLDPLLDRRAVAVDPQVRRVPVVLVGEDPGDGLGRVDHLVREPVDRRRRREHLGEGVAVHVRDPPHVEVAEPLAELVGTREGGLGEDALVVEEPEEHGVRLVAEVLVDVGVLGRGALDLGAV